jgi:2-dehydropantoate 2-reductase
MNIHIHILGAGAMGALWASQLARNAFPVTIISRNAASPNLEISYQDHTDDPAIREATIQTIALRTAQQVTRLSILLVCVKTYQLEDALQSVRHAVTEQTQVVLLQNGMGNGEIAQSILPPCQLFLATTTHGAYIASRSTKGHQLTVIHAGRGTTSLGPATQQQSLAHAPQLCQWLQWALPDVIWHFDIERLLWKKLMINAAINPLTALFQCRNGELLDQGEREQLLIQLIEEMSPVLTYYSPELKQIDRVKEVIAIARATANNYSSMYQDLASGRETELEAITGYLLRQAQQLNIQLPSHSQLYQRLKEHSFGYQTNLNPKI